MNFKQLIRAKNIGFFPKGVLNPATTKTMKDVIYVSPTADTAIGRYMSTFYKKKFTYKGTSYPTIEHAYQAIKFKMYSDNPIMWMKFRCGGSIKSPKEAQRMGTKTGLKEIGVKLNTDEWELNKYRTFRDIVFTREKQDPLFHQIVKKALKEGGKRLQAKGKTNTWITSGVTGGQEGALEDW